MKRFLVILWCLVNFLATTQSIKGSCSVTPAAPRLWDVALHNLSQSDVILSKLCFIEAEIQSSFDSTFTVLETIKNKVCMTSSESDVLNNVLSLIDFQLDTINSKLDVMHDSFNTVASSIDSIHVNDFGGTWTALDTLHTTMDSKLDSALLILDNIESELDILSATQQSHFIDTFTALQQISDEELALLIELTSISDELITGLSQIDTCILMAQDILITAESKIDVMEINLEVGFAGTFTVIDDLLMHACTVLSKSDVLEEFMINTQLYTYTAIAEIESKLCVLDSKVDELVVNANNISSQTDDLLNMVNMELSKTCIIESKAEDIITELNTIESKLDVSVDLNNLINSSLDTINIETIIMKTYTIESKVDVFDTQVILISSKIDIFNILEQTIASAVDALALSTLASKVDILESNVDVVLSTVSTISSKVDVLDNSRITITSIVDYLNSSLVIDISKSSIIESIIDGADSKLDIFDSYLTTLTDITHSINSSLDIVKSDVDILVNSMRTLNSNIDAIIFDEQTLLSKVCVLDSFVDGIDSKIDLLNTLINIEKDKSVTLLVDMQQTWTILDSINSKISSIISEELTISSKLSVINVAVDLSGVYTAIAAINTKTNSIFSSTVSLDSRIDVFNARCIHDLGTTFTALNATLMNICTTESRIDVLVLDIDVILEYEGIGISIPLTITNFSDTYTISIPGRYALTNDVPFNPGANQCIYVNTDDVHINLCHRIMYQTNGNSGIVGIRVANGMTNVSINNGNISDFTGGAIVFEGNNNFIRIDDVVLINNGSDQLSFNSLNVSQGIKNVLLNNVTVDGAGGDCIQFRNASGIRMTDCVVSGATSDGGINMNACDYIIMQDCTTNSNNAYGIAGAVGSNSNQPFGMTNFVIDSCVVATNTTDGIRFNGFNKNGLVVNCVLENNGDGIRFATASGQVNQSTANCIVSNVSSNNTSNSIQIDGSAKNNYFADNQMFENTSTTFLEDSGEGPNSVLRNYAFKASGTNYTGGLTSINKSVMSNTAAFPATEPTYWINADVSA